MKVYIVVQEFHEEYQNSIRNIYKLFENEKDANSLADQLNKESDNDYTLSCWDNYVVEEYEVV